MGSSKRLGAIAQLGEHLLCKQGVVGSIPTGSTSSRGQRTEDRGQRTEDRGQRAEGRGQRAEGRGQRTEDRRQRTEDRGQKTEGSSWLGDFWTARDKQREGLG